MNSYIKIIDNAIPNPQDLILAAERLGGWVPSAVGLITDPVYETKVRKTHQVMISGNVELQTWDPIVKNVLAKELKAYCIEHKLDVKNASDEGYSILKYVPGDFYLTHPDTIYGEYRDVSAIIFLNSDFTGGEVYFPAQEVTITPNAGQLVLFPSYFTHMHEVKKVLSGVRYSVVTWFKFK